jgi:hypothetical protein
MRLIGLTLCLLASSLGARAESVEDRVAALEARVKALEEAVHSQAGKPAGINAANIDGTYTATSLNGETIIVEFANGKVVASSGNKTKIGTYEIIGQRVFVTTGGKAETLMIDGDVLHDITPGNQKIDFIKNR